MSKTSLLTARVSPADHRQVRAWARQARVKPSQVIRDLIAERKAREERAARERADQDVEVATQQASARSVVEVVL